MAVICRKLLAIGDGATGKSCLLNVLKYDKFPSEYHLTSLETYAADIKVDGKQVCMNLQDTPGQEDYDRMRPLFYPDTDVILLFFSIDSPVSLQNIQDKWIPEINNYFSSSTPFILVGNKADLRRDPKTLKDLKAENKQLVSFQEGQLMATMIKATAYMECSGKENNGVTEILEEATRLALKTKSKKSGCSIL